MAQSSSRIWLETPSMDNAPRGSWLVRLGVDLAHPAFLPAFDTKFHPPRAIFRVGRRLVFTEILQRRGW
jgi:hypothetical protein